ncbi:MAG: hypothetical protein AAF664_02230 [Planctomycetota bacterium]
MSTQSRLDLVRDAIHQWMLANLPSRTPERIDELHRHTYESFFIVDDYFGGRRFRNEAIMADWFIDADTVKIHETGGLLLGTIQGDQIDQLAANADYHPQVTRRAA